MEMVKIDNKLLHFISDKIFQELTPIHQFILVLSLACVTLLILDRSSGTRGKISRRSSSDLYGNADWSKKATMKKIFGCGILPTCITADSIGSFDGGGLVVHSEKQYNGTERLYYVNTDTHSLVFGSTGSGKTTRIVLPTIMATALADEDMIITDPKGEIYGYTSKTLKNLGYELVVIDFAQIQKSMCFNPLQDIIDAINANDISLAMTHTNDLVQILVPSNSHSEKIWTDGELATIGVGILSVVMNYQDKPQYQNLYNVYHFLGTMGYSDENQRVSKLNDYIKKLDNEHPAKIMFMIASVAPSKTRGSFFTSAMTTLRLFTDRSIAYITSKTDFKLVSDKKRAIFLILPDEKATYNSIATIFISMHYKQIILYARKNGGMLPRRLNYILEEAGNCPPFPDIMSMLTAARSRGIRFLFFLQAIEQLRKLYDEHTVESIYANCENIVLLKSNNEMLLEKLSKRLGTYTATSSSHSYSKGGTSRNVSFVSRPLMYAWELRELEAPTAIVFSENYKFKTRLPFVWDTVLVNLLGLSRDKRSNIDLLRKIDNERPVKRLAKVQLAEISEVSSKEKSNNNN